MNARRAIRFLQWAGDKAEAGHDLTSDELILFNVAREASLSSIKKFMRLGPEDWKYIPGEPFE